MTKPELIIMGIGVLAFVAGLFLAWLQRRCHHKYFLVRTGQGASVSCPVLNAGK